MMDLWFWFAFCASAVAAAPILHLLQFLKAKQSISKFVPEGHQVKVGTPNMGGLIPLVGLLVVFVLEWLKPANDITLAKGPILGGLVIILGLGGLGFVDDYVVPRLMVGTRGLGWTQKLLAQFAIAGVACYVAGVTDPFKLGLSIITVCFFSNAYNFSDGLDGLASLILVAFALGLICLSFIVPGLGFALMVGLALLGSILPFLFLNWYPARVFMGDTGSLPIGGLLGFALIPMLLGSKHAVDFDSKQVLGGLALSLVMLAELVPVPLQIASVKLFKRKLFPYTPIHHAFEKAGWPETRVVGMFFFAQILASALALTIMRS